MVNAKVEIISNNDTEDLQRDINEFLALMDIRQVIRMEYSMGKAQYGEIYSCIIMYIKLADIRDIKIDTILDK